MVGPPCVWSEEGRGGQVDASGAASGLRPGVGGIRRALPDPEQISQCVLTSRMAADGVLGYWVEAKRRLSGGSS